MPPHRWFRMLRAVQKAGQKAPELYTKGPHDYESLTKRGDLDLVVPTVALVPALQAALGAGRVEVASSRRVGRLRPT